MRPPTCWACSSSAPWRHSTTGPNQGVRAMAVIAEHPPPTTPTADFTAAGTAPGIREWLLKRGILWGMTQTPLLAILGGVFFHIAPYRFLMLPMLASFIALPIWVAYRKKVSTDADEPV